MRTTTGWVPRVLAVLVGVVMGLTVLGMPQASADPARLRVAVTQEFGSLNPFTATSAAAKLVLRYQYESLVEYGQDNSPEPGMAQSWTVSPDGETWTYTLPIDRQWSDGQQISAQDAAYTLKLLLNNPGLPAAAAVSNIRSAQATSDSELEVVLNSAQATNPMLDVLIVPQHIWTGLDPSSPDIQPHSTSVVGSGPFSIAESGESRVLMRANPMFWRGTARFGTLEFQRYPDTAAATTALADQQVDVVYGLTPQQYASLGGNSQITRIQGAGDSYVGLLLNTASGSVPNSEATAGQRALADQNFRAALASGLNKQRLMVIGADGLGTIAD
jgi:peptide/nickel transport system substrate-binding protein